MKPSKKKDEAARDKTRIEVRTPHGFWASAIGESTAVIAIVAVIGLIVISIYVVRLAERAIDRNPISVPAKDASP